MLIIIICSGLAETTVFIKADCTLDEKTFSGVLLF